jgi:hypothetical protein
VTLKKAAPGKPFQKGQSGNPGGRPKEIPEVRAKAREMTVEALETLAAIMRSPKAPPPARVTAAVAILDRGWGKPTQPIDGDGEGGAIGVEGIVVRFVRPT